MSDASPPPSDPTPPAQTPEPAPKGKPKRQPISLRRKLLRIGLALLLLFAIFRLSLGIMLRVVANKVASQYGLKCEYDRMALSLSGGTAFIWNLQLRAADAADKDPAIFRADYLEGYISPVKLLEMQLVVWRAEADGVDITAEREADGSIPLLKRFMSKAQAASQGASATTTTAGPINLQVPLRVDALRLIDATVRFRDESVTPAFAVKVQANVRVSNIGNPAEPARLDVDVAADPVLDTLHISGVVHNTATTIDADMDLLLRGLHPKPAAAYLLPIGLRPVANQMTVRAQMHLSAVAHPNTSDISATLAVSNIIASADDRQYASLDSLTLDAPALNATTLKLGTLSIAHGSAEIGRSADGHLQFAGLELVPVAAAAPVASTAPASSPPAIAPGKAPWAFLNLPAFNAELHAIEISDLQLDVADDTFVPAITTSARLQKLSVGNIILDPARVTSPAAISGQFTIPGIVQSITLTGSATRAASTKKLDLVLNATGIRPDAARLYLDRLGIDSQWESGQFSAALDADATVAKDGALSADLLVSKVALTDQGKSLLAMNKFGFAGSIRQRADRAEITVRSFDADGPTLSAQRDGSGGITALGFRLRPASPTAAVAAQLAKGADPSPSPLAQLPAIMAQLHSLVLPAVDIDSANWGVHLNVTDQMGVIDRPINCELAGNVRGLKLDPAIGGKEAAPGDFSLSISVPQIVDKATISGQIRQLASGGNIDAIATASGITGKALTRFLAPMNITPTLQAGLFDTHVQCTFGTTGEGRGLTAQVSSGGAELSDGKQLLAQVGGFTIGTVALSDSGISVGQVAIDSPKIAVSRAADGSFAALGVRLALPGESARPAPAAPLDLHLPSMPIAVSVKSFELDNGQVQWTDQAVTPTVSTTASATVSLGGIGLSSAAAPSIFHATASIAGTLDHAKVDGSVKLAPDAPALDLVVEATGLRAGALSSYLPAGVAATMKDGHFATTLHLDAHNNPAGGIAAKFVLSDLDLADTGPDVEWARVGQFTFGADRIDPAKEVIAIGEVSSRSVSAKIRRLPDGQIEAAGLVVGGPTVHAPAPAKTSRPILAAAPTSRPAVNVAELVAASHRPFPLVTIDRLDMQFKRVEVEHALDPDGAALALSDARLHAPGPIAIGGPHAAGRPPVHLLFDGTIDPVAKQFAVDLSASPFLNEPAVKMDMHAGGISAGGIIKLVPELAAIAHDDGTDQGTLATHLWATVNYQRRGVRDFDLSRGFVASFGIDPLEYRDKPDGPIVTGFQSLHADEVIVKPMTGNVRAKLIEINTPIGHFYRDKAGVHALGLVIPIEDVPEKSAPSATTRPAHPAVAKAPAASPVKPLVRPSGEIRIDRLTVSGIDMRIEDRTTSPVTVIPIKTLDAEVTGVSNQMPWTDERARFSVLMTSDKVWLPPRQGELGGATTRTASGEYLEQRDLFSEITASGKIGVQLRPDGAPVLIGWAKTSVDGFELLGVRGVAAEFHEKIGGGVLDDSNDIQFKPDAIYTNNRIVFTNLSLSEPANGPLQKAFNIPVPIDVGIGMVTDPDGSITLGLPVKIKSGQIQVADVLLPACAAVGGVMVTAIASAPIKAINIFGGGHKEGNDAPQIIHIPFIAGYADVLDPDAQEELAGIAKQLHDNRSLNVQISHELSPADVERSAQRANPSPEECQVLADRLRGQKAELLARRAQLAAAASGQIPSQSPSSAATLDELRGVDRNLADIENSLDQLLELFRAGSASQANRRTRAASVELARARMVAVHDLLAAGGDHDLVDRIHTAVPGSAVAPAAAQSTTDGGDIVLTLVSKRH